MSGVFSVAVVNYTFLKQQSEHAAYMSSIQSLERGRPAFI
jgi:hypothetical protein